MVVTSDLVSGRDGGLHRDHIVPDRPESLAAALADLQQHLPRIGKDAQAQYGRYADLADVTRALLPVLAERGFSWVCCPTAIGDRFELRYWLRWDGSDEIIEGYYPLPRSGTPQQIGSAITYARRYCLLAVTGAAPDEDDDDAQAAEQAARAQRNAPPEVDEHGAATVAELTRMDRGPEPGAWRSTGTAENDGWYDAHKEIEPMPVEDQSGTSQSEQRRSIYIALGKHGIKDFKSAIERLIRRDLTDPKDMSYNEAVMVRARVDSWDGRTEELLAPLSARPVEEVGEKL